MENRTVEKGFSQGEEKLENGWLVWSVEGRIEISNAERVYSIGEEIVEREAKVVMDMSGVNYISSAGLRVLMRLLKKAAKEGKVFTAAGAAGYVRQVLVDSNMHTKLALKDSLADL